MRRSPAIHPIDAGAEQSTGALSQRPASPNQLDHKAFDHQRTRATCGPERLQADLSDHGVKIGIHLIKRIRKKLGLRCKQNRKFRVTTDSKHTLPIAKNVLNREFAVTAPTRSGLQTSLISRDR